MQISIFHPFCVGIVAEAKSRDTKIIQFYPTELRPFFDGEVKPDRAIIEDKGVDAEGKPYVVQTEVDTVMEAEWIPLSSTNRRTAPDVQVGEMVHVYQTGDNDKYYWVSSGQKDGLRKLETVIFAISNNTDPTKTELSLDDCYFFLWSTHDKVIMLQTSDIDGEPFKHTFLLDTAAGNFSYSDSKGNKLEVDSPSETIRGKTASGGLVELVKRKFTVDVDDIDFKFKKMSWKGGSIDSKTSSFKDNGKEVGSLSRHTSTAPGTPTSPPI